MAGHRVISVAKRVWSRVDKTTTPDGCWEWIGQRDYHGYGTFSAGRDRKNIIASRMAWELTYGYIPQLDVLHHCDNPACVRPEHLFLGTQRDNVLDASSKGRLTFYKGEHNINHKFEEAVREIRSSTLSQRKLATKFGVARWTIISVLQHESWKEVK